mmetsp:Transcript_19844/g.45749  ORF Transcript_19844/g.45749 Transcript_19844/m.45749 type:complete len:235 (+) Transcript_19844:1440-2144(+)
MRRVSLLPQELARAQKWRRVLELPPHHIVPLVELERQISMRMDPPLKRWVHDRFGGGTDGDRLSEVAVAGLGHPCHLRREALHVLLLCLQLALRDEHGEVAVLHAERLDLAVEEIADRVPDRVRPGPEDVAARDVVELDHLRLDDDLLVPLGEVALLRVLEPFGVGALDLAHHLGLRGRLLRDGLAAAAAAGGGGPISRRRRRATEIEYDRVVLEVADELEQIGRREGGGHVVA